MPCLKRCPLEAVKHIDIRAQAQQPLCDFVCAFAGRQVQGRALVIIRGVRVLHVYVPQVADPLTPCKVAHTRKEEQL